MNGAAATQRQSACLILDDGAVFYGEALGQLTPEGRIAEVVFNTSMSGYQEIITDPSYLGQMVVFTYPSIGNYGINHEDNEANNPYLDGIILRDYCEAPSNFRSVQTLDEYLKEKNLAGLTGVDTRALVRHIREKGAMRGGIFPGAPAAGEAAFKSLLEKVQGHPEMGGRDLTGGFSGQDSNEFIAAYIAEKKIDVSSFAKVALLDFGVKRSILTNFLEAGILPKAFAGSADMASWSSFTPGDYDGFFLSNGPGDPAAVKQGIENIKKILEFKKPIFGICLGHQMLSEALGAKTFKLKFGHHGGNQPVKAEGDSRVIITAQNHGFAVEPEFFESNLFAGAGCRVEKNPNDNTVEGFFIADKNIISVQYHPEAGPGPNDAIPIFQKFKQLL